MNMAIEWLIIIAILVIVIILVLIFLTGATTTGGNIDTQNRLRLCCNALIANDCIIDSRIQCSCTTTIDENGNMETTCQDFLINYISELGWSEEEVRNFCGCSW